MRILSKYIIKELMPHFFIGLLAFTFLLLSSTIIELTAVIITKGINYSQLFLIILYSLPPLLVLTIPMALLLALLVGLGRLSADFELIIMRNLGISHIKLFLPILIFSLLCWLSSSYFMISLTPKANKSMVDIMYKILTTKVYSEIKPRVFYDDLPNITLYINDITKDLKWKKIFLIYKYSPEKHRILLADSGYAIMDDNNTMIINLYNGSWHENNEPGKYSYAKFTQYQIPVKASSLLPSTRAFRSDREMTLSELSKEIEERKKNNLPYNSYAVEWHKKFSIPFACIVFAFVGFIFYLRQMRVNRFSGYSISIFIILLYYTFLIFGERFSDEGYLSPFTGAWLANIIISIITLLSILFIQTRTYLKSFLPSIKKITYQETNKNIESLIEKKPKEQIFLRIRIQKITSLPSFILDRYIIKEFLKYFSYAAPSFTIIFIIVQAFHLIDDLIKNNIPLQTLLKYLKFSIPNVFYLVIPLSAMTAVLVSLSIFSRNNEITAIKANGISLYRIALPIILAGFLISSIEFLIQEYILPYTNKIANNLLREIKGLPQISYASNINNWVFGEKNNIYNFAFTEKEKNIFYNFQIIELVENTWDIKRRIYSQYAYSNNNLWYLHNADIYALLNGSCKYHKKDVLRILLQENADYFQTELKLPEQMSIFELYEYMMSLAKKGYDITHLSVDFYHKPSFASASLVMILIGLPFSFSMGKKGTLYGIGISILFGIFYWAFMAFCKSLGYVGILPPLLAAWAPNIFLSIIAIALFVNIKT